MCFYGTKSSSFINQSFHRDLNENDKNLIDYSTKKRQDFIIDLSRANEILKSRILAEGSINKDKDLIIDWNEGSDSTSPAKTPSSLKNKNNNDELNSQINNNNSTLLRDNNNLDKPLIRKYHSSACLFDNKKSNVNDLSITPPTKFILFPKNTILANFIGSIEQVATSATVKNKIENDNIINKSDPDRVPSPDQTFISNLLDKS
jgi:hypothetical protein